MALGDTGRAIGAVTSTLRDHLKTSTGLEVVVGRTEPPTNVVNPHLNLFLYETKFDPNMKNISLDNGQPAPLWLILTYLLTAFDDSGESDSAEAHEYYGSGIESFTGIMLYTLNGFTSLNT